MSQTKFVNVYFVEAVHGLNFYVHEFYTASAAVPLVEKSWDTNEKRRLFSNNWIIMQIVSLLHITDTPMPTDTSTMEELVLN